MPSPLKIEDLKSLDADDAIKEITGTLVKLYEPKDTPHGQLQNGELKDETGTHRVTFVDNIQNHKTARNKKVTLRCIKGSHGWTGVKLKDEGEKYGHTIWVTGSAEVEFVGGGSAPSSSGGGSVSGTGDKPARSSGREATGNQWKGLNDIAHLYEQCLILVNEKIVPHFPADIPVDTKATMISSSTATLMIAAERIGLDAIWDARVSPAKSIPSVPPDPADWRECYIPSGSNAGKSLEEIGDNDLKKLADWLDEKGKNDAFAECVYAAARSRKVEGYEPAKKPESEDQGLVPSDDEDDIPF